MATLRASTSVRLGPREKELIAKAAETIGADLGEFIRIAARERAEHVMESAAYRDFVEKKVARAFERREKEPSLTDAELRRRLALRRKK